MKVGVRNYGSNTYSVLRISDVSSVVLTARENSSTAYRVSPSGTENTMVIGTTYTLDKTKEYDFIVYENNQTGVTYSTLKFE